MTGLGRYLFIIVFILSLVLAAWGDQYKMNRKQVYTDVLGQALQTLKPLAPASGILYYRPAKDQAMTEGLIRARFMLAPLVLLPAPGKTPDTLLLISNAEDTLISRPPGSVLWAYTDTLARYELVSTKYNH